MSDADDALSALRERLAGAGEDRLGKALSELLENPLFTGAVTCAFDARELAVHAQETAMAVLNIPSAADIERLTRRLRSMSQRIEGVEDALFRLEGALAGGGLEARLSAIEDGLVALLDRLAVPPPTRPQTTDAPASTEAPEAPASPAPAQPARPVARTPPPPPPQAEDKPAATTPKPAAGRAAKAKRG